MKLFHCPFFFFFDKYKWWKNYFKEKGGNRFIKDASKLQEENIKSKKAMRSFKWCWIKATRNV